MSRQPKDNLERKFISVHGLATYTRMTREPSPATTPPVVLVHGLGISGSYLIPTAIRLASDYRVYIPDLPGFGKTRRLGSRILTIHELSDFLFAWTRTLGLQDAVFVGNSFGCQIIADLALRHPTSLSRAVFIAPTIDSHGRSVHQELWRVFRDAFSEQPSLLLIALRDYLITGLPRTFRTLHYAIADPIEQKLAQMQTPTLVVRGEGDRIVSQQWAEKVASLLPHGQLAVISGAGHAVNYQAPEPLLSAVLPFLRGKSDS